jgi:hypothetical protein
LPPLWFEAGAVPAPRIKHALCAFGVTAVAPGRSAPVGRLPRFRGVATHAQEVQRCARSRRRRHRINRSAFSTLTSAPFAARARLPSPDSAPASSAAVILSSSDRAAVAVARPEPRSGAADCHPEKTSPSLSKTQRAVSHWGTRDVLRSKPPRYLASTRSKTRRETSLRCQFVPPSVAWLTQQLRQLGEVHRQPPRLVARQPIWSPSDATQRYVRNRGEAEARGLRLKR